MRDAAPISRRAVLGGAVLAAGLAWPRWARSQSPGLAPPPVLAGATLHLRIDRQMLRIDGRLRHAIGINGHVPAPLLRLREGQRARIHVENGLDETSSLHWHGLLLPFEMDGVPGISFPGIAPGAGFTYDFPVRQAGTYWYHSHSGLQEQIGLYGPIVIDPAEPEPFHYAREHVLLLSDHSPIHPHRLFARLKRQPDYYNDQRQTLAGLATGRDQRLAERLAWGRMRMDPTDLADVTAAGYDYLVNGHGPAEPWTGLFRPGETVRLRLIGGAAMTIFNVRIPGLALRVVQADGQLVRPVVVDELQIAPGETFDLLVTPEEDRAYALVAETIDRSGAARAVLAPRPGLAAPPPPPLRPRPLLTMRDMGMEMGGTDMAGMDMRDPAAPGVARGPGVQMIAAMPADRTGEPGTGLAGLGHRVLVYRDLVALTPNPDARAPERAIDVHLTGNMERYMWSFDGTTLADARAPIALRSGERVRVTLINDTMMNHPIHLHGHYFELVTGHGDHAPRKHSVTVQPGGLVRFDVTAVPGDWAFHCHLLFHMHAGMMRVVQVRDAAGRV
ncbi:copper resistance system multicopper oxidase [Sphingomonas morindae]|uniref:Copper resistance system multicopper oxidase n=1 Tax=Sphingomonas morindae TaxID=1541170 RepID=A0ABY4XDS6_9SPHN|nr:copper resistance system multicopper oxidase [Sphingomonas morindae]USI74856.1 copper resistance system multicopper oxidase [Sphingomonas morindae]